MTLELVRDTELRSAKVTLAPAPDDESEAGAVSKSGGGAAAPEATAGKIGVRVDTLDDEYRGKLGLPAKVKGAVIVRVDPSGAAAEAGLAAGDVVTEINGTPVVEAKAFVKVLDKVDAGKLVRLMVNRKGTETFIAFVKP